MNIITNDGFCVCCGGKLSPDKFTGHFSDCEVGHLLLRIKNLNNENIRLGILLNSVNKAANFYRHKCKIYGEVLSMDGSIPSDCDLVLLKQLENEMTKDEG